MFKDSNRKKSEDKYVESDLVGEVVSNQLFIRLGAKGRSFRNVDFRYSIFDSCYIRSCSFDSCDFTGCKFIGSNFYGTSFSGCKFDYATFERTILDADILATSCPGPENLKLKFARSLRMNFQQLGDAKSANRAIAIELLANEIHLHKSWKSPESYYRKKYKGFDRVLVFFEWLEFKLLDLIWGNGESAIKLLRTVSILLIVIAFFDATWLSDPLVTSKYINALVNSPQIFFGCHQPKNYPGWYLTLIVVVRLIMFALFMSILIKRFSRR